MKGVSVVADIGNGTMNTLFIIDGRPQIGRMFTEKFGTTNARWRSARRMLGSTVQSSTRRR